jgi:hypothetical protein
MLALRADTRVHLTLGATGMRKGFAGLANLAYNMRRLVWIEGGTVPA